MSQSSKRIDISVILNAFKKPLKAASTLEMLLANVPDVFSKEKIEPENYKPFTKPEDCEIFV